MATKQPAQKSKTVHVVYFGSVDNNDMPNDCEYKGIQDKLSAVRTEDIRGFTVVSVGPSTFKLKHDTVVLTESEILKFAKTKDKRAVYLTDVNTDQFVRRASTQLELVLEGRKLAFVLVPYYIRLSKERR